MATTQCNRVFQVGDKVCHRHFKDDVGTVIRSLGNDRYMVRFFLPGRKKTGYISDIEFEAHELVPCFIDLEAAKAMSV